jgi:serine/threonine protein kinase
MVIHNRYRIVQTIGQGGMGAVYEAVDMRLSNTVALKQTLVSGENLSRAFKREAQMLAALRHPVLPRVIDYFTDEAGQFLVMEFFPGADLGELLDEQHANFTVEQILKWGDQLLDALAYLHNQSPSIIHRDIKPQNLKPTQDNGIVLLDFGLAKGSAALQTHLTSARSIVGYTPQYAPPEQIDATGTDTRSDIYSLSATLYRMFTGQVPTPAIDRLRKQAYEKSDTLVPAHAINPRVPPQVSAVLAKGMELDPKKRYATAAEMQSALQFAASTRAKPTRRWILPVVAGSVAIILLLVLGVAFLTSGDSSPSIGGSIASNGSADDTVSAASAGASGNEPGHAADAPTEQLASTATPTPTVAPSPTQEEASPIIFNVEPTDIFMNANSDPVTVTVHGQWLDQYDEIMIYDERTDTSRGRRVHTEDPEELTFRLRSLDDLPAPPERKSTYIIELRGDADTQSFALEVRDFIREVSVSGVQAEYIYTRRVAVEDDDVYTYMRLQPDADSEQGAILHNDDTLQIVQQDDKWYQARIVSDDAERDGQIWWIERWLVDNENIPPRPTATPVPPTPRPQPTRVPQSQPAPAPAPPPAPQPQPQPAPQPQPQPEPAPPPAPAPPPSDELPF